MNKIRLRYTFCIFDLYKSTLVNVYIDLLVFMPIAGTS